VGGGVVGESRERGEEGGGKEADGGHGEKPIAIARKKHG